VDSFPKELIVVGDRVLIAPEDGEEQRTRVGLYLPASAIDSLAVQTGLIINTGPGDPLPDPSAFENEPWKVEDRAPRTRRDDEARDAVLKRAGYAVIRISV